MGHGGLLLDCSPRFWRTLLAFPGCRLDRLLRIEHDLAERIPFGKFTKTLDMPQGVGPTAREWVHPSARLRLLRDPAT